MNGVGGEKLNTKKVAIIVCAYLIAVYVFVPTTLYTYMLVAFRHVELNTFSRLFVECAHLSFVPSLIIASLAVGVYLLWVGYKKTCTKIDT